MNNVNSTVVSCQQDNAFDEGVVTMQGRESSRSRALYEALALALFGVVASYLVVSFGVAQRLISMTEKGQQIGFMDVAAVLLILLSCLFVFVVRRCWVLWRRLQQQAAFVESIDPQSLHDSLTRLPNRRMAIERLQTELSRGMRDGSEVAVQTIDLDRFRQLNDVLGHDIGDELLKVCAARLAMTIRDMDMLARIGSDRFVVIQPGVRDRESTTILSARLVRAMDEVCVIKGQTIDVSISVGAALSSPTEREPAELLRVADIALNRAKADGGGAYSFFETDMDIRLQDKRLMEQELREAIKADALVLFYQPLFDVNSRRLIGFEALLRWHHDRRGSVSPADFIPLAEETGLIIGLGDWVLERAVLDALRWEGNGKIAVNLSPVQFRDRSLPAKVASVIKRSGFPANRLELEITEGVLIEDADTALNMLVELKALGVRISMDDFGTGYSSLSYLKRFPFDKIKIDRSFVSQLQSGSEDAAIVRAILAMGHSLGMIATAEGVESAEQLSYLLDEGCDEAQGFLLGRPMPFSNALALTRAEASAVGTLAANDFHHGKCAKL